MKPVLVDVSALLGEAGREISYTGPVAIEAVKLGRESVRFPRPPELEVGLAGINNGVVVTGTVRVELRLSCGRCLNDFDLRKEIEIEEFAQPEELITEDGDTFPIVAGRLDLAPIVYQNVMTEVPIRPLCRQSCAGLCAECGKNLNDEPHIHEKEEIDDRLAPLKKYFEK